MVAIGTLLIAGCSPNIEKLKDKQDIEGLIKALEYGRDSEVWWAALEALVEIGEPSVEPLIETLEDEDRIVRGRAELALGKIRDERAVEPLINSFRDGDDEAAWALVWIGEPAIKPLIDVLKDKANVIVIELITSEIFERVFSRQEPEIMEILKQFKQYEEVVNILSGKTKTKPLNSAEILVMIGEPSVKPLIETLKDKDDDVRCVVAWILGEIGDKRAIESLTEALNSEDDNVRDLAVEALEKIKYKMTLE